MTIEEKLATELTPHVEELWGQRILDFVPPLVSRIWGDGRQLLYVEPVATRPRYYLARIDSACVPDFDWIDDEVLDAIEEEFGSADDDWCRDGDGCAIWPALEVGDGWFFKAWPEAVR